MADEMDESLGSEENKPAPEEQAAEGAEASSGDEATPELTAASKSDGEPADIEDADAGDSEVMSDEPVEAASLADEMEASEGNAQESVSSQVAYPERFQEAAASAGSSAKAVGPQTNYAKTAATDSNRRRAPIAELDKPGLDLLYDVELDATLQFGSKEMLLRDVLELGPGDVVELDRHIAEPVDLVVGDRIVARGEVVVASGNFALRVTEVATPQMRLESIRCLF